MAEVSRHLPCAQANPSLTRRDWLLRAGGGFGAWALLDLLKRRRARRRPRRTPENPLAPKPRHFPARAKRVISLFMQGGPSHIDTFDPKPLLARRHGQPLPPSVTKGLQLQFTRKDAAILGSPQTFTKCGRSGIEIADTYPHLQTLRRRPGDRPLLLPRLVQPFPGPVHAQHRPSRGWAGPAWARGSTYGLGSETENLPAFVVMATTGDVKGGPPVYDHGFLPGTLPAHRPAQRRLADPLPGPAATGPGGSEQRGRARHGPVAQPRAPGRAGRRRRRAVLADRHLRAGLPHAEPRRPRRSTWPGDRGDAGGSTASTTRSRRSSAPTACSPGGWSSAASGSCRSSPAARGRRLGRRPRRERQDAPRHGPADRPADRRTASRT